MNNKNIYGSMGLALLFEIVLIATAFFEILSRQKISIVTFVITALSIFIPFLLAHIAHKKNILLPSNFQSITVLYIFLTQYVGEIMQFYTLFWWWDLLLHFMFGFYIFFISLHVIQGNIVKDPTVTNQRFTFFTAVYGFSLSITLGTFWEIFEFIGDYFFGTHMVKGGLVDTATDLLAVIAASLITAVVYYFRRISLHKAS